MEISSTDFDRPETWPSLMDVDVSAHLDLQQRYKENNATWYESLMTQLMFFPLKEISMYMLH